VSAIATIGVRAVAAGPPASFDSRPDLRVRAVTQPSPRAVFRHIDMHGPPPRDRLERSTIVFPKRNVNHAKENLS